MKDKLHIAVLMGGPSWEHDISLKSGKMIIENAKKHKITPIIIQRDSKWAVFDCNKFKADDMADFDKWVPETQKLPLYEAIEKCISAKVDIFFNAMHGAFGEDGIVQGVLEAFSMPFTGSSLLASSISMNKIVFKQFLCGAGIKVPRSVFVFNKKQFNNKDSFKRQIEREIGYPCFVKTPSSGSSIGVSLCGNSDELVILLGEMFELENRILIEEYISGREFTCAVIGNAHEDAVTALPVTEIISSKTFFDFEAKYTPGMTEEITPAKIDEPLKQSIQDTAVLVHNILECKGFSRTDMIVSDGNIYVLELNAIPGMTQESLLPKAAIAQGMTLEQLIDKIILLGLREHDRKKKAAEIFCRFVTSKKL
ncbi:D-alanine--D-alanine ligase [bacterium]|nr:D-alanine--D-alanine ligase [bacterium]